MGDAHPEHPALAVKQVDGACQVGGPVSDDVKPALTPEEWAEIADDPEWWADRMQEAAHAASQHLMTYLANPYRHHALAALALYGQPFGFTRDDVAYIRAAANALFLPNAFVKPLESAAKRIESLLPPEPTP